MANQEQLEILKQGVQAWAKWKKENLITEIDLRDADLRNAELRDAELSRANLSGADLREAKLMEADLSQANLKRAKLSQANLKRANLSKAKLSRAKLKEANLSGADLGGADLGGADLGEADLTGADLSDADFSVAQLYGTTFANTDLGNTKGLESIMHGGASTIGTDVLSLSMGKIPELFLRGCGLSDWEIEFAKLYQPNITNHDMDDILYKVHEIRAHQPLQISRLFISHSHADSKFVDRVEKSLIKRGIRFWRDIHHSTSGPLEEQIDRAISQNLMLKFLCIRF